MSYWEYTKNRGKVSNTWASSERITQIEVGKAREKANITRAHEPPTPKQREHLKALRQVCLMHGIAYPKDPQADANRFRFSRLIRETNIALKDVPTRKDDLAKVCKSINKAKEIKHG